MDRKHKNCNKLYEYDDFKNLKEMLKNSYEKFGDYPAFKFKTEIPGKLRTENYNIFIEKINALPQVEQVKDKDFDILYLTDYVDEFAITAIQEYDSHKFANVENNDLDLETEEEKEDTKKANEKNSDLLKDMASVIGDVSEVKFTNKLKKHPVCLTTKGDVSIEMQKVFDAMPNDMGIKAEMILEINEKHPISDKLKKLYKNDKESFDKYTKILYSEARMIAGLPIDNPTEISTLICDVISK